MTPVFVCEVIDWLDDGEENLIAVKVRDISGAGGLDKGGRVRSGKRSGRNPELN